jgi:heme oxygenase
MSSSSSTDAPPDTGFIATELRGAAMKLHTTQQAPKEGKVVVEEPKEKYITTHEDYLAFLVDSKHVYEALEDIVNQRHELSQFRNTGLERTKALELDIKFMVKEYGLKKPEVGEFGRKYAAELRAIEIRSRVPLPFLQLLLCTHGRGSHDRKKANGSIAFGQEDVGVLQGKQDQVGVCSVRFGCHSPD